MPIEQIILMKMEDENDIEPIDECDGWFNYDNWLTFQYDSQMLNEFYFQ